MVYTIVVHFRAKDEPGAIEKLTKKLQEASQVYSQDKETISWYTSSHALYLQSSHILISDKNPVRSDANPPSPPTRFIMRDHRDPRSFTIVERYDNEDVRLGCHRFTLKRY